MTNTEQKLFLRKGISLEKQMSSESELFDLIKDNANGPYCFSEKNCCDKEKWQNCEDQEVVRQIKRKIVQKSHDSSSKHKFSSSNNFSQLSKAFKDLRASNGLAFDQKTLVLSLSSEDSELIQQNVSLKMRLEQLERQIKGHQQNSLRNKEEAQSKVQQLTVKLNRQRQITEELKSELEGNKSLIKGLKGEIDQVRKRLETKNKEQKQALRQHYELELFKNAQSLNKIQEKMNEQFNDAKEIGQSQINQLISKLNEKDNQITRLLEFLSDKKSSVDTETETIKSTANSENSATYLNRFMKFSQFIDKRMHMVTQQGKKHSHKISKFGLDQDQENRIPTLAYHKSY